MNAPKGDPNEGSAGAHPSAPTEQPRALVVDDSRTFRWVMCAALRELGFATSEAADGFSALAALRRAPSPALLVLDLHLPGMNGPELLRALRVEHTLGSARSVLTTGDADRDVVAALATRAGADAILGKPFTREELVEVLASLGLPTAPRTG